MRQLNIMKRFKRPFLILITFVSAIAYLSQWVIFDFTDFILEKCFATIQVS
jgi:hypothetical protein